ncbi:type IV secretion system protein TraC [Methylobacter tundripaludum]|jgi:conjugal transfer ATP-binding protein TraC|uniref:type IV secretion system protein TraC n=1 Tax=Methylobacter tundripaludum TaxID=173365 RepID=UPI000484165E|nr:type IV secretion system protein TraC [Methylobacter tundripaludum]
MGAFVYEKQLKRHTLSELVPVESFDEETHLFTMADGTIGFGFVAKPLPGGDESVTQRLNVLFSFDYPKESFIQIMLMGSQDIRPTLDNIKHIRNTKDEALQESLNNRLKMLTEGSNQAISLHAQSYVREYKVVFSIKLPLGQKNQLPKQHEISAARDLRLSFEQTLKSAGFVPQTIDAELYLRVVGQILHWSPSANWRCPAKYYDATTPVNEQLSEYDDMIQTDANGVWLGDKRLRILSPGRLQGQMSLQNMRRMIGDPLTGARGIHGNFFINLNIFIPDNAAEKQKADKERNVINYQAFGPMLKFNPKLIFKKESTDLLFKSINDGDRILKIKLCVGLFTDSLDKSENRLTEAQTYFSEIGWSMKEDKYITLPMLVNSLPLCADLKAVKFLQRYKRCGSKHAVEFLPIISDWSGTGTPQLTFISRGGQIMNMDIFDSNTNYNTCIVAASGSGKSFLTNDIITSYISSGAKCWVIDIGRSYEKLTHAIGGDFVEFGEKSQICLNPFQIIKNYNEEADMLVGIIVSMAAMEDKLSDLQHARLRSILKELWDEYGVGMTVDRVAEKLLQDQDRRVIDMGHQLFAFTSTGEYGRFFNGENNVNFNNALTCLELEELKGRSHLQQVVLLILIYQIQQAMYLGNRDQRKILIIDEAWDLLAKGNIARFIETGYRRFRKYNGAAITITQSLNDLYSSPSGVAIAENSANLYLLYQKPETIESIKRQNRLMIGEGGFTFLKSVHTVTGQYSEIFFVTSYGVGIGRLIVDKYTKLLYSTHPDDIKKISERTSRGMTTAEAIEDILVSDD